MPAVYNNGTPICGTVPKSVGTLLSMTSCDAPSTPVGDLDAAHRPTMTIDEAAAFLRIARSSAYAAAKCGELPTISIGRRLLVPTAALRRMLQLDDEGARRWFPSGLREFRAIHSRQRMMIFAVTRNRHIVVPQ